MTVWVLCDCSGTWRISEALQYTYFLVFYTSEHKITFWVNSEILDLENSDVIEIIEDVEKGRNLGTLRSRNFL